MRPSKYEGNESKKKGRKEMEKNESMDNREEKKVDIQRS